MSAPSFHDRVDILSVLLDPVTSVEALRRAEEFLDDDGQHYIVTPNPEMVMEIVREPPHHRLEQQDSFWDILVGSDLALADGFGLVVAQSILGNRHNTLRVPEVIHGVDFMQELCEMAMRKQKKVLCLGAAEGVAEQTANVLRLRYDGLTIEGHQGFNGESCHDEELCRFINEDEYDIVFVAYGAVKQEQFIARNLSKCPSVSIMMGVGGSFDFIAQGRSVKGGFQVGGARRAPVWMRRLHLEWLWRLLLAPWRFRRIFRATIGFLWAVLLFRFGARSILRDNILACLYREGKNGKEVLIGERSDTADHWQMVQGGVDKGETARNAAVRELKEELGLASGSLVVVQKELSKRHEYIWPYGIRWKWYRGRFKGQSQALVLAEFKGKDSDIDLAAGRAFDDGFSRFRWVSVDQLVDSLYEVRREAAALFLPFLK